MKNSKNFITVIIYFFIIIIFLTTSNSKSFARHQDQPEITSETAVLMEMDSGKVLFDKDKHRKMHPASTTKIMTSLLLMENCSLREIVEVSPKAYGTPGSSMYLGLDDKISVRNLLYGIMVQSANDGAIAAAEHVSGSVEEFANKMNERAKELGAINTSYKNPHGLTEKGHKTSAFDLAVITREALQNPKFRKIAKTNNITIPWPDKEEERMLVSRNQLLNNYEGAIGVKTGYTRAANRTFVAAAERDDMTLIAVLMSATGDVIFEDAKTLLDYGFDNYLNTKLMEKDDILKEVSIINGAQKSPLIVKEDVKLPISKSRTEVKQELELKKSIKAPIEQGKKAGTVKWIADGEELISTSVYFGEDINQAINTRWWFRASLGGIVLMVSYITIEKVKKKKSSKRQKERFKRKYRY
ncbi:D-alanyl-D-alanine carboxypeptidase family protein [Natranaerobius trueperi]|uniref:serine-type D-Ala-D-Ala carboxypeptidase n=1 Tax=Natranaerobius trueperi TaxID=759412 RepID=A0A226BXB1_9FIRM|nr:D-alanyl-D-alanine carboxypeptidase family protein [Natranaerobius trueperi]OWZ83653.1 D-alanyl-D-alanine carboxypeptidase [Natranaerobius trueperi]